MAVFNKAHPLRFAAPEIFGTLRAGGMLPEASGQICGNPCIKGAVATDNNVNAPFHNQAKSMTDHLIEKPLLGWREWVALPDLNIHQIKAKIDTGARSSALHAFSIEPYRKGGESWVMFAIHPIQKRDDIVIECHAPVKDRRVVSDSGGHKQRRYVIETRLLIGQATLVAEMTLTNREQHALPYVAGQNSDEQPLFDRPRQVLLPRRAARRLGNVGA